MAAPGDGNDAIGNLVRFHERQRHRIATMLNELAAEIDLSIPRPMITDGEVDWRAYGRNARKIEGMIRKRLGNLPIDVLLESAADVEQHGPEQTA